MSRARDLANLGDEATGGLVKADIGLGNVDNTSDADKPVSTAQQTALDAKLAVTTASSTYLTQSNASSTYLTQSSASSTYAPLASPAFTGTPTGITASHITSGTLGNTVQDNITRLGTVTTGTLSHGTTLQGYVDSSNTGVTFPAGHVLQTKFQTNTSDTVISITASSNPGVLYSSGFGNRTYGLAQTIQIYPSSTSNILFCIGQVGWTAFAGNGFGAHGSIITLNDSTTIKNSDYPWYPESNFASTGSPYWPGEIIWGVFSPSSTSQQTIRLRPFNYRESGTRTVNYNFNNLLVMEIAQ